MYNSVKARGSSVECRVSKFAGAHPLASAVPAAVRPRQFWPPHHPQGRNRPPHLGFQQCDHPSRCGAEPPNQQEPHTHSKWWRRHDADDDGNGRYAEAHRPARTIPRPRRPLSSVGQSCGLLIRRSWVRAPQGVPASSYPNPPQSKQAGMRFQMMNNAHPPGWALFVLWVSWLCDGHQDADHAFFMRDPTQSSIMSLSLPLQ